MSALSQSITLLERYEPAGLDSGCEVFCSRDSTVVTSVWINRGDWEDMGSPNEVTVTVQPGDRLNGESS